MKKKLYFDPPKPTKLNDYITIKYGKIRDMHFLFMPSENPKGSRELVSKVSGEPIENFAVKDTYQVLKNFHMPLKLKKVDKYIRKQKRAKYTHEIILLTHEELSKITFQKKIPTDAILKMLIRERRMFIRLNFIERAIISYFSFSWSKMSMTNKLAMITTIISVISLLFILFS